jgi:hypothetical protein
MRPYGYSTAGRCSTDLFGLLEPKTATDGAAADICVPHENALRARKARVVPHAGWGPTVAKRCQPFRG